MVKTRGRTICDALKQVRQQIADANGIVYSPRDCKHEGECRGTCPACEAEVRWLEDSLISRYGRGFAQKVAGVAVGMLAFGASANAQTDAKKVDTVPGNTFSFNGKNIEFNRDSLEQEGYYLVKGIVKDESGEPLIGAYVTSGRDKFFTATNIDGEYLIPLKATDSIEISFIGMKPQTIPFDSLDVKEYHVTILQEDDSLLQGEVVVLGSVSSKQIKRENKRLKKQQRAEEKARKRKEKAESRKET